MSERFQQLRAATRSRFRIDFRSISTIAGRYRIDFGRVSHRFQASQAAAMSISKGFPVDWNRCKALPERCRIDFRLQKHSKQWKQYRESSVNEGCKRMASETSAPPKNKKWHSPKNREIIGFAQHSVAMCWECWKFCHTHLTHFKNIATLWDTGIETDFFDSDF